MHTFNIIYIQISKPKLVPITSSVHYSTMHSAYTMSCRLRSPVICISEEIVG